MLAKYATELAQGGGIPKFTLDTDQKMTREQAMQLKQSWWESRMQDLGEPWKPAVLTSGVKANPLQLSPQSMELKEMAQFNESRIAVLVGVPPFLLGLPSGGDSMTYSNVSQPVRFP